MVRSRSQQVPSPLTDTQSHSTILNGWKDIAAYVGRGVRTVQRWEALGLPIRRPNARLRSAVVSTTREIDAWLENCGDGRYMRATRPSRGEELIVQQTIESLRAEVASLRAENTSLRRRLDAVRGLREVVQDPRVAPRGAA